MFPLLLAAATLAADPLPPDLAAVPTDAAVFAHADVAKLWPTKLGDTFRKTEALEIAKTLSYFNQHSGVTPPDRKTITFWVCPQKQDGQASVAVRVRTTKPLDRVGIVKEYKNLLTARRGKQELKTVREHVYEEPDGTLLDLSDPMCFNLHTQAKEAKKPGSQTQAPAIALAAAGKPAVVGLDFEGFPSNLRTEENVPPQLVPFRPIVLCDTAVAVAEIVGTDLTLDVKFTAPTRVKAQDAEKSLAVLKTLIDLAIGQSLPEIEKEKHPAGARTAAFAKAVREAVKKATIRGEENTAGVTLKLPADSDYAGFLEMAFGKAGSAAGRGRDSNNLKQIALAMHNYDGTYGTFPSAATAGKKGKLLLSWRVAVLPYLDQAALYEKFKLDEPWDSAHNKKVFEENPMPGVFLHPTAGKAEETKTHYQVFVGNGAAFDVFQGYKIQNFQDGTSNTVLVATAAKPVEWTKPDDIAFDPKADPVPLLLMTNDNCMVAFADGSVRAIQKTVKAASLRGIITRSGGEVVNIDD